MLLFCIVFGVALFIFLLLFVPVDIGLDYQLENKTPCLRLQLKIFGIPFSVRLPIKEGEKKSGSKGQQPEEKKNVSPREFIAFSKSLYGAYKSLETECRALLSELRTLLSCRRIYFVIRYGTSNPARTGLLNGAIWTAGTLILKVFDLIFENPEKTLEVYPEFNRSFLSLHMKGTFRLRLFDAVKTALKVLKLVKLIRSKMNSQEINDVK